MSPLPFAMGDDSKKLSSEQYVQQEKTETVTMLFPRRVLLTLDNHLIIVFPPGAQEVPEELKDHPYLLAHGVKLHDKISAAKPEKLPTLNEAHLKFAQDCGRAITTVEQVNKLFQNFSPNERVEFLFGFSDWLEFHKRNANPVEVPQTAEVPAGDAAQQAPANEVAAVDDVGKSEDVLEDVQLDAAKDEEATQQRGRKRRQG